jgi:NAD dependent epimerase/dehydratase family enzyme
MAAIILEGSRVSSEKIMATGFKFNYPNIKEALEN